jgi:hypothetical protein
VEYHKVHQYFKMFSEKMKLEQVFLVFGERKWLTAYLLNTQVEFSAFLEANTIDGQVCLVCLVPLVRLQMDNFCLFLCKQTDKQ